MSKNDVMVSVDLSLDLSLLREQKLAILRIQSDLQEEYKAEPENESFLDDMKLLDGVIYMIDSIQDQCVEQGIDENVVFNLEKE